VVAPAYEERFLDELDAKPRDRELLASFAERTEDPVVELGCGPGQVGAFVRSHGRWVAGADLSLEMARRANRRLDGAVTTDLRRLPQATESVGGIVAFYCVIHLSRGELPGVFAEMARVLRPGGLVLVTAHEGEGEIERAEFVGHAVPFVATLYRLDELTEAAEPAGLSVTLAERRGPYPGESGTTRLHLEALRPRRP
jgi:SAM-dependent methyltransferase